MWSISEGKLILGFELPFLDLLFGRSVALVADAHPLTGIGKGRLKLDPAAFAHEAVQLRVVGTVRGQAGGEQPRREAQIEMHLLFDFDEPGILGVEWIMACTSTGSSCVMYRAALRQ